MKRLAIGILAISCILAAPVGISGQNGHHKRSKAHEAAYVPGELLVKYKGAVGSEATEYFRSRWGVYTLRRFKRIGIQHVKLPRDMTVEEALEIYRNDPDVEYAAPNYLRYARDTFPPVGTLFSELWGLHNTGQIINGITGTADADIDAPEAWDTTTGNMNVVVAVIDSGVAYDHPDLAANMWANSDEQVGDANSDGFPGIQGVDDDGDGLIDEDSQDREPGDPGYTNDLAADDDENGYVDDIRGWDFVDDDNDPMDSDDHGTHVAGTVAAVGNNNIGITGVSWTARIMPLRFLNGFGVGTDANAIRAIEYANAKGAHVINNSWGGGGFNQFLKDAIDASTAVVVCAAGNAGTNNDAVSHYPSSYTSPNIIAVAATDQNDSLASFSNYGATSVDVAAPGTNILSSRPDRQTVWSDNFESGLIGWTINKVNGKDWGLTAALSFSPANSLADSPAPADNYDNNTDSWAIAPVLNLSLYKGTKLEFKLNGSSEPGFDFLYVQSSTDLVSWTDQDILIGNTVLSRISGTSAGAWFSASVDLGAYDGNGTVYIRLRFTSDGSVVEDGWYIDDVSVSAAENTYVNPQNQYYQYFQGTSMATPHVSGLAALLLADDPGLSAAQVKERILNGAEVKSGLAGMILTGARINAYHSIRNVPAPPSALSATAASSSTINLTWSDGSYGEDGFKLERKMGIGGMYAQVATTTANTTTYSDTGLAEATTYYYRVRSYNGTNNSDFSAEVNAATAAPSTGGGGGGGGGGGCFIATAGFDSHLGRSADFMKEPESAKALQIKFGLALLAALGFVTFRWRSKR